VRNERNVRHVERRASVLELLLLGGTSSEVKVGGEGMASFTQNWRHKTGDMKHG